MLKAEQVSKRYQMGELEIHALRGVDFSRYAGEMVVVLGASGSGKSTLLDILGGLDTSTEGYVHYRGWSAGAVANRRITDLMLVDVDGRLEAVVLLHTPALASRHRCRDARLPSGGFRSRISD